METDDNASETKDKSKFRKNLSTVQKIPPMISPINTPQKNKSAKPENKSSSENINKPAANIHENETPTQTEEIKVMLCASNQQVASNVMKKFPLSTDTYQTRNKNHFVFSPNLPQSQIKVLKKDPHKVIKPPQDIFIVNYFIPKEEKTFYPQEKKHCPGCDIFD